MGDWDMSHADDAEYDEIARGMEVYEGPLEPAPGRLDPNSGVLLALRRAILSLDDQRAGLAEVGDMEGLVYGGRDLDVIVGELSTVLRQVRVDVARIIDDAEHRRRERIREDKLAEGKEPPAWTDPDRRLGRLTREVDGFGLVTVNGGYDRKGWDSLGLLRRMLHIALDPVEVWASDGSDNTNTVIERLMEVLGDTMPLHPSLGWRVGTDWAGKPPTGLRKYGVNPDDWCERSDKDRLAAWPKEEGA